MEIIYEKWRELDVDIFNVKFKTFEIKEIINYFPAGNDVIEAITNKENYVIKIERSKMADFNSEINNINYLKNNNYYLKIPNIIENGYIDKKEYIVCSKIEGNKLYEIFNNDIKDKQEYLIKYGNELATIHSINGKGVNESKKRLINDYPKLTNYKYYPKKIKKYIEFLKINKPLINNDTFIHGDFHYGNILWKDKEISAIIDFEYSGRGFKEQDIAWALILRPGQKFMDNIEDIKSFIKGYKIKGNYNKEYLKWCYINGCCHFYLMNKKNKEYIKKLDNLLLNIDKFDNIL